MGTEIAQLPRVTEILKAAGLIDTQWLTDAGRDRGTYVHQACQFYDEGDLDESTLDPAIAGYVLAYKVFRDDSPIGDWDWVECPMHDPLGLYRGTEDRIVERRPRQLWDIKTGCQVPSTALQLAAYVNMLDDPYSYRRFAVYLKPTGQYKVVEYPRENYARDLRVFMSALNLYQWRQENHV